MPKVSGLCVTRCAPYLQRALDCWERQTHLERELIIVHDRDPQALQGFRLPSDARVCVISPPRTLGELRNFSIAESRGDYLCQWDDDDWYHPQRIAVQLATAERATSQACALRRWVTFDMTKGKAYLSNPRCWEGSLLWHRDVTGAGYPAVARGEDTPFADRIRPELLDRPDLYIYVYHGGNTWTREHFENLFAAAAPLNKSASDAIARCLAGEIEMPF
jgi:glycosyltransferase involved in cell wall biosynthesis